MAMIEESRSEPLSEPLALRCTTSSFLATAFDVKDSEATLAAAVTVETAP